MPPHLPEFLTAHHPLESGVSRFLLEQRAALSNALLVPVFEHTVKLDGVAQQHEYCVSIFVLQRHSVAHVVDDLYKGAMHGVHDDPLRAKSLMFWWPERAHPGPPSRSRVKVA
jgi:hypothetical protein